MIASHEPREPDPRPAAATALRLLPRRPREDALPEHVQYRDDGCDLFSSCLACPLPRCRYDTPGGARALLIRLRDLEIRRLRHETGLPVEEIAVRFRVSRRTVFRVLQHDPQRHDRDGSAA
jgi:hypothetical protein